MKLKRIFAIIAVILLVVMYGSTIVFALSDNENAGYLFKASIFCTIVIPALIQLYAMFLRAFGPKKTDTSDQETDHE